MSNKQPTNTPKINYREYYQNPQGKFFDKESNVVLPSLIVIELDELTPEQHAALVASLTYIIESINAGEL